MKGVMPMGLLIEKLKNRSTSDSTSLAHKRSGRKHMHKLRRCCAKVVVDRVLAEEVFTCCETTCPCDIGIAFPPCSVLNGTITVTVIECDVVMCGPLQPIQVDITLLIQKELTVTEPNGRMTPLEFTFHRQCRQFFPPMFKLHCINPKRIRCDVFQIKKVCADIDFVCANPAFDCHATIAEQLEICLLVKLIVEDQLEVRLCRKLEDDF